MVKNPHHFDSHILLLDFIFAIYSPPSQKKAIFEALKNQNENDKFVLPSNI